MSNSVNNSLPQDRPGTAMLKNRKAVIALAPALALAFALTLTLLSLTGCGSGSLPTGGSGIESPVVINYVVNNPLTFQEHREGNNAEFDYVYLAVNGLKDKGIEQAINGRIKEVCDGLRVQDLPPYRGIKQKIADDAELVQEQVRTSVSGNFNNILSITVYKYIVYRNPSPISYNTEGNEKDYYEGMRYFSEEETLNFDLNTGEEIRLKDLFCDDVDHMELINDRVSRYLAESHADEEGYFSFAYDGIKLVEPFRGLPEDQMFSISPNGIGFVFDYRTPQFDTDGMAASPWLNFWEFGDTIAVTERFFDEAKNIYTSEAPPVKSLAFKENKNDISGNEYHQEGGIYIGRSWGWSSGLPEEIRKRLTEMNRMDQEAVNRLREYFGGMSEDEINEAGGGYYNLSVSGHRIGSFINIYRNSSVYMPQFSEETLEYHCYDGETLEELTLSDIFAEGYDYKPAIMDAIRKVIEEHDENYKAAAESGGGDPAGEKYSEEQYEAVYEQIDGFRLDTEGISIHIVHPVKGNQTYGLFLYLPFTDLGCENMNIFR